MQTEEVVGTVDVLRSWVRRYLGLAFAGDQRQLFTTRVEAFCAREKISVDQLYWQLPGNETLLRRLADALSTPHTYFLREPDAFQTLRDQILPAFRDAPELRMWSAAAAAGDEAYSMAMVALETFGHSGPAIRVLGTDISDRQVCEAERGEIPETRLNELDPVRRARWFRSATNGSGRQAVVPELRALCTFRRMNLTAIPWPFTQTFQVIFLRNVLYYFDDETVLAVVNAARDALEPGGYLITSVTEPIDRTPIGLTRVGPAVYRRDRS